MSQSSQSAKDVFLAALEVPRAERSALLDEACAANDALRQQVELLLEVHDEPDSLLDRVRIDHDIADGFAALVDTVHDQPVTEALGTVIGPYKLLQQIGEGGMGVVYMAEQSAPVQRKVALKIVKLGVGGKQAVARFEAERQALALMEHPNIAKVLDAGVTESGRPFFVMELVKGVPITEYCDAHRLTPRERLELFLPVCQAVQHAHTKGLIHRDLKPSNVLVALYDGQPVPKVIDFGVAKATGGKLTDATLFTEFGAIVGTLEYMSPEQAELNQLDVDTRSDIYSLGVLLYELLTGTTPLDRKRLNKAAVLELLRLIREEETTRPSIKLSTIDALPSIAANRKVEPTKLAGLLRGELDWIVMKALEKDRSRRYETANGLAMDLQRYLHDEAVLACPPSRTYRLRKFARRNKAMLLTAAVVAAALVTGTLVSTWMAVRATQAERSAEANYRRARRAVDDMYTQVAEKWLAHQPQMESLQREFLQKSLQFYTEFSQESSTDPAVRLETATAFRRVAEIQHKLGAPAEAEQSYRQAIDRLQELVAESPAEPEYRLDLAYSMRKFGVLLGDISRYVEAEQTVRLAIALHEQLSAEFPDVPEYRRDLALGKYCLADVLGNLFRQSEAEEALRDAVAIQRELVAQFPAVAVYRMELAGSFTELGSTLSNLGRRLEAQKPLHSAAELSEKLAAEFPSVPVHRNSLACTYFWLAVVSTQPEAEQSATKALEIRRKLAADFPAVTDYRHDLVRSLRQVGAHLSNDANRRQEAEHVLREALAVAEKLAADAPGVPYYLADVAMVYETLARLFGKTTRLPEAEDAFRHSITIYQRQLVESPDAPSTRQHLIESYLSLGSLLADAGRPKESEDAYQKALAMSPKDARISNDVAWHFAAHSDPKMRNPARAVEQAKMAVELKPAEGNYWNTLGVAHYRAGEWKDAQTALEKSMKLRNGGNGFDWFFLAMAHWQLGNKDAARERYTTAVGWMEQNNPQDKELQGFRTEAETLLGIESKPK